MSKNVAIKEGSTGKQFGGTKKLRTNIVGGGTADWVPEDEVQLTSLYVTENGTYNANDEGYYGYNPVTVSGIGGAEYTAQEGDFLDGNPLIDGNKYWIDEYGVHEMPSYIQMTTPPIKTKYYDGDAINLAGAVIQAFNADGSVWSNEDYPQGGIPYRELTIVPPNASLSESEEGGASIDASMLWSGVTFPQPLAFDSVAKYKRLNYHTGGTDLDYYYTYTCNGCVIASYEYNNFIEIVALADNANTSCIEKIEIYYSSTHEPLTVVEYTHNVTQGGYRTKDDVLPFINVIATVNTDDANQQYDGPNPADFGTVDASNLWRGHTMADMWQLLFGEGSQRQYGNLQEITLTWNGYGSGEELSTTFIIDVRENQDENNENNENNEFGG